ncbi:arginase family protein [Levilactobacillus mulengensis]|mgnify:CR=1 FL=1|uniref:arginase family protein n=1 Tax=Levilactobacillus mulengensis TaxID=2486025 RepID=UPI000F7A3D65|nr:arginase family protein [Levilactobacillus mulengensis]
MDKKRTIRLVLPQWPGASSADNRLSAQLLSLILPPDAGAETIQVPLAEGIVAGGENQPVVLQQIAETQAILAAKHPDHVITAGGGSVISAAPVDYLSGKYGEHLGLLWLGVHPDIADPSTSSHLSEMVAGNLLGQGDPALTVQQPLLPRQLMYAGLNEPLRPMDQAVTSLGIRHATAEDIASDSQSVLDWLAAEHLTRVAVHFDLDVLTPADFRSILPAQSYTEPADAGTGELALRQVVRLLQDVSAQAELVGFSIAAPLPQDALNLRQALSDISIFN